MKKQILLGLAIASNLAIATDATANPSFESCVEHTTFLYHHRSENRVYSDGWFGSQEYYTVGGEDLLEGNWWDTFTVHHEMGDDIYYAGNCPADDPDDPEKPEQPLFWPTSGWTTASLDDYEIDENAVNAAVENIATDEPKIQGVLMAKNGQIVFEQYWGEGYQEFYSHVWSVTKSFTSTAIGIAIDEGLIANVDVKLSEIFPEYFNLDVNCEGWAAFFNTEDCRRNNISIRHALTMSTGVSWNELTSLENSEWQNSENWLADVLSLPQQSEPGSSFNYNSGTSHILSGIINRVSGQNLESYLQDRAFQAIGLNVALWEQSGEGNSLGGFGLHLTARQMAKLGLLFSRNGEWDGEQIVSENWVSEATQEQISANTFGFTAGSYGYQWWITPIDGIEVFSAIGFGGQYIVVAPELDVVVVIKSDAVDPASNTSVQEAVSQALIRAAM